MVDGATKFYRPTLASLRGKELLMAEEKLSRYYSFDEEIDRPVFDFVESGDYQPVMTRRIGASGKGTDDEFVQLGDFQITYNFSSAARKNVFRRVKGGKGTYGETFSFRMLYEFLSGVYNGGEPFVDTYFARLFKTRRVYRDFLDIQAKIQDDINNEQARLYEQLPLTREGRPDMRFNVVKRYADFSVWQDPIVKEDCKELAEAIRQDIITCLKYGILVRRSVSPATASIRKKFSDIHPNQLFYASGQLIEHMNIFVEIENRRAA
jgi:hypothetical protein